MGMWGAFGGQDGGHQILTSPNCQLAIGQPFKPAKHREMGNVQEYTPYSCSSVLIVCSCTYLQLSPCYKEVMESWVFGRHESHEGALHHAVEERLVQQC
jgi:hypothetical protein